MIRFFTIAGLLLALMALSGCETVVAIKEKGATAADASLNAAEWAMCEAATAGSIKRKYKTEEEKKRYRAACPISGEVILGPDDALANE